MTKDSSEYLRNAEENDRTGDEVWEEIKEKWWGRDWCLAEMVDCIDPDDCPCEDHASASKS